MPRSFTIEQFIVEANNNLSDLDKAYMVINYPRNNPHDAAQDWTLEHALDVAQVPKNARKNWNVNNVREKFRQFNQNQWDGEFSFGTIFHTSLNAVHNLEPFIEISVEGPIRHGMHS
jgi:hypothetical protein